MNGIRKFCEKADRSKLFILQPTAMKMPYEKLLFSYSGCNFLRAIKKYAVCILALTVACLFNIRVSFCFARNVVYRGQFKAGQLGVYKAGQVTAYKATHYRIWGV